MTQYSLGEHSEFGKCVDWSDYYARPSGHVVGNGRRGCSGFDNKLIQGRTSFQGTSKHVIWLDEECDFEIYTEFLLRTMTTDGIVMATSRRYCACPRRFAVSWG